MYTGVALVSLDYEPGGGSNVLFRVNTESATVARYRITEYMNKEYPQESWSWYIVLLVKGNEANEATESDDPEVLLNEEDSFVRL